MDEQTTSTVEDFNQIKAGVQGVLNDAMMGGAQSFAQPEEEQFQLQFSAEPLPATGPSLDNASLHQVAESIINERWDDFLGSVGNITMWKERTERDVVSVKQELVRMQQRFNQIEAALLGKVTDYEQDIKKVHTEMRALEKVFERILEPLVSNVKELGKVTEELKKIR